MKIRHQQSTVRVASLRPVLKVFMSISWKDLPPLCTLHAIFIKWHNVAHWRICYTPNDKGTPQKVPTPIRHHNPLRLIRAYTLVTKPTILSRITMLIYLHVRTQQKCIPWLNAATCRVQSGPPFAGNQQFSANIPIYGIVWMCVPNGPLFQRCQVYDWPLFFSKKYMIGPIFLD